MLGTVRRLLVGGVIALAVVATLGGGLAPNSTSAAESKPFDFDVSARQFKEDCEESGGDFHNLGGGRYVCSYDGWEIECSSATDTCKIYCDPGVPCVNRKRIRSVVGAVRTVARLVDEQPQGEGGWGVRSLSAEMTKPGSALRAKPA